MTNEEIKQKVKQTIEHIKRVQDNCFIIAYKLIDLGRLETARTLIYQALNHDLSKFDLLEFEPLVLGRFDNHTELQKAIELHRDCNRHHPEFYGNGIRGMSDVDIAEFVSDCRARSYEMDNSLHKWIDEEATKRWGFTKEDPIYKRIMFFVDLLVERPY